MSKGASGRKDRMVNQSGGTEIFSSELAYIYSYIYSFSLRYKDPVLYCFSWTVAALNLRENIATKSDKNLIGICPLLGMTVATVLYCLKVGIPTKKYRCS